MRTTFLCVLCVLLSMVCWAETTVAVDKINHLRSTIKQTLQLIKFVKQNDTFLCSPNNDIEDCCSQSALRCFHSQLLNIQTTSKQLKIKLHKNLNKTNIVTSMGDSCSQTSNKCKLCDSYPMVNSTEFLKNLLNLLQKSYSRLI